ncbi:DMT family transporter [Pelagovum pacificum]|uniref:DMT family transporter n=1 Tax=Pelagovum pacificum TaxID=2588711 RepID=A0A5C5GEM0_9RHOB|nr:DMT family transporter [Pelagovum pacificum]QQA44839.1 DMT family transporter [Pelagovum pacificum]TNY32056.1 DMT family transporter [Pelagovum pacificum]
MTQRSLSPRSWLDLLLLALVWGGVFLAVRLALREVGPLQIVAMRVAVAALVLWGIVLASKLPVPRRRDTWGAFAVMGLLNNVIPFWLITWGQQHIDTGLASILNASSAVWGVGIAALVFEDERLTLRKVIGVLLGLAGVATAVGLGSLASFDPTSLAQLAILGATMSYGIASAWGRATLPGLPPLVAAAGMLTCSAVIAVPLALLTEGLPPMPGVLTWGALAYASVVATAGAYLLYYRILAAAGSGHTLLVTLMVSPIAILIGALALGETLRPEAYVGFTLLAAGLIVIDGRLLARLVPRRKGL